MKKVLVKNKYMPYLCCLLAFLVWSSVAFVYMLARVAEPDSSFHLISKTTLHLGLICWIVTVLFLVFLLVFVDVESNQAKMDK